MSIIISGVGPGFRKVNPVLAKLEGWITVASLGVPRYGGGSFYYSGKIYVVGGVTTGGRPTTAVEWVDLTTYDRGYATPLPEARSFFADAFINNKYYVIGGSDASSEPVDTIYEYDPSSDSWNQLSLTLPKKITRSCSAVYNDLIYLTGGMDDQGNVLADTYEIDLSASSISQKANMNTARENHACGELEGSIYVFGGDQASGSNLDSVEKYNPSANTWEFIGNMPEALSGIKATKVNIDGREYILILGG